MDRFADLKKAFATLLADRWWWLKVLIGGTLLINPLLIGLLPKFLEGQNELFHTTSTLDRVFFFVLGFNAVSFWFPLGFTFEVLRRARIGKGAQLPSWSLARLPKYAREGAVKLVIASATLLLPVALWLGLVYALFIKLFGLPEPLLSLFIPPIILFVIPFCGVGCLRWLDGASVLDAAFNYPANFRAFRASWQDYLLLATAFILGVNSVTTAFFYTIPFGAIFGLCLVDIWFGPIYAQARSRESTLVSVRP